MSVVDFLSPPLVGEIILVRVLIVFLGAKGSDVKYLLHPAEQPVRDRYMYYSHSHLTDEKTESQSLRPV